MEFWVIIKNLNWFWLFFDSYGINKNTFIDYIVQLVKQIFLNILNTEKVLSLLFGRSYVFLQKLI